VNRYLREECPEVFDTDRAYLEIPNKDRTPTPHPAPDVKLETEALVQFAMRIALEFCPLGALYQGSALSEEGAQSGCAGLRGSFAPARRCIKAARCPKRGKTPARPVTGCAVTMGKIPAWREKNV
jgi:hypothetical protein